MKPADRGLAHGRPLDPLANCHPLAVGNPDSAALAPFSQGTGARVVQSECTRNPQRPRHRANAGAGATLPSGPEDRPRPCRARAPQKCRARGPAPHLELDLREVEPEGDVLRNYF